MNEQMMGSEKKGIGCAGIGVRLLAGLLVLLIVLGFSGFIYEGRAEAAVEKAYPAPGQVVEVKGRMMHIVCTGTGSPTIVLDAGQGGWSSDWAGIMPELSQNNRVCAYDRAGYGWSDGAADERSPQDAADDLAALLSAAQVPPPYLLVGFSHAGLANRIFAAQHADQMAGLVLVDPATEYDNEMMSAELMGQQQAAVSMFDGFGLLARMGLLRLLGTENMAGSAPFIGTDPASPDIYYTFIANPDWWETSSREFKSGLNEDHMAQVRDQGAIQDIPLIIIGSDVLDPAGNAAISELQAARHETLSDLADQSTQGSFIIASGSTHNVISDRPDVVVAAITALSGN